MNNIARIIQADFFNSHVEIDSLIYQDNWDQGHKIEWQDYY